MYIQYALQIERAEYMQRPAYSTIIVRPLSSSSRPSRRVKIPSATYTTIGNIILSLSLSSLWYTIEASTLPRRRGCCPMRLFDYLNLESLCIDSAVCRHSREKRAFFPCRFFFLFRIFFFPQRHTRLASLNDNFLFFFSLSLFFCFCDRFSSPVGCDERVLEDGIAVQKGAYIDELSLSSVFHYFYSHQQLLINREVRPGVCQNVTRTARRDCCYSGRNVSRHGSRGSFKVDEH